MRFCKVCDREADRYADGRCKACCSRRYKAAYQSNPEYFRNRTQQWSVQNTEKKRLGDARYRLENSASVKENHARWHSNNKARAKAYNHNRRARVRNVGGKLSLDLLGRLIALQLGKCACCKCHLKCVTKHLDHIVPIAKGGMNVDSNIQLLCQTCNLRKSTKAPEEFMQSQGFLL